MLARCYVRARTLWAVLGVLLWAQGLYAQLNDKANDFSGVRLAANLGLSIHYMEPKRQGSASSGISFFSPALCGNVLAGCVTSEIVYWGFLATASYLYGKESAHYWTVIPRYDYGLGVILGSIVENTFLTSICFGVKKTRYDISDGDGSLLPEGVNMIFFGIKTAGALTEHVSSEVSYDYALALSREESDSHYRYAKRTTMHVFSIGLVLRL